MSAEVHWESRDGAKFSAVPYAKGKTVVLALCTDRRYEVALWKQIESCSAYEPPIIYTMTNGATWPHSCLKLASEIDAVQDLCEDF